MKIFGPKSGGARSGSADNSRRRRRVAVGLVAGLIWIGWLCRPELPEPLFDPPYSGVLFSREGRLLGARIAADGQWRFPPPGTPVPHRFRSCLVAFEDRRFEHHYGVDPAAMVRALLQNLGAGRVVSGGSTISMQVVRMARGNQPRSYREKSVEALLAISLERRLDKQRVLSLYAAHAPFGGNVVGLEAAAWRYFGRRPEALSWAESCLLAVLPNSPALMHPGRSREALRAKRDRLLRRLAEDGLLEAADLRLAMAEAVPRPRSLPHLAPRLLDTLLTGGAAGRLNTTLDAGLQRSAAALAAGYTRELEPRGIHNVALLIIDRRSFDVLAYVGNAASQRGPGSGHAIDMMHRPRSTGSILKPFLYVALLQQGELSPYTLVADVPTYYPGYRPRNFDMRYRGAVPARLALARSLNVPAVRLLQRHGVQRFQQLLRDLGMSTLHRPAEDYGLPLVLGGAEGTLWELAGMYADLAASAASSSALPIRSRTPRILREATAPGSGAVLRYGPGSAWLTLQALLEVRRPGIEHYRRLFQGVPAVAWKTGTSFGHRDGWAIGVTPRHVVAVWTGNAPGQGAVSLTGARAAAPLLFRAFALLPAGGWFPAPMQDLRRAELCRADGYLPVAGCSTAWRLLPRGAAFQRPSPNHRRVHLDAAGWRVHSDCELPNRMRAVTWFILPPAQAAYYRARHPDYRPLPPWRADCRAAARSSAPRSPMELLYPSENARIYLPTMMGGARGAAVFQAAHRDRDAVIHWHLDHRYLGDTREFHDRTVRPLPGRHVLTLVDERGLRLQRVFHVLEAP